MGRLKRPGMALALLVLLAGCAQPSVPAGPLPAQAPAAAPATADGPSPQAEMVCAPEAQEDIEDLIGAIPTSVGPLQYADHVSTCRYTFGNGSFSLVVRDLPDDATTANTFAAFAKKLGQVQKIDLPGAEAFSTTDGSVVLRKDTKVMLVDVAGLPATFGDPPAARADEALLIMKAVLGCWTGA